jgi:UDP-galactopyranose mutase
MLKGIPIRLNTDFFEMKDTWRTIAKKLVYSGPIDQFYNYEFGKLEYRSLKHKTKILKGDYQGNHQFNFTEAHIPYTRIIEHKHFNPYKEHDNTVVTWEYPDKYKIGKNEPFYPIGDEHNLKIYHQYHEKSKLDKDLIIGGRLGSYKYLDMDQTIAEAFHVVEKEMALH